MTARALARIDRLGALLAAAGLLALVCLPFVISKSNRIVPGDPRGMLAAVPAWMAGVCQGALLVSALVAVAVGNARLRLVTALLAGAVLVLTLAAAGNALTPPGNKVVRIAAGPAFWVLLLCLGLMATDAVTRLRPGPCCACCSSPSSSGSRCWRWAAVRSITCRSCASTR